MYCDVEKVKPGEQMEISLVPMYCEVGEVKPGE
jgi:hypothetical protein